MTVQNKRSPKSRTRSDDRGAAASGARTDIGWGLGAESDGDDLFVRRVLFYGIVAVLGCLGAWFMITTVGGGAPPHILSAAAGDAAPALHTIVLQDFEKARADDWLKVARSGQMQSLAGGHELRVMDLSTGRCALCVGRFDDPTEPRVAALLEGFAAYSLPNGSRPFEHARLMPIAR